MVTGESSGDSSTNGDAGHVFISHHSSQYDAARQVKAALAQAGIRGWLAPDDVDPGSAFDQQILAAMREARAVVLLLCARSDRSRHVKREVMLADDADKPVFPVRLEPVKADGLAYWLKDHQWIDWFGAKGDGLGRLVAAIREAFALPRDAESLSGRAPPGKRFSRGALIGGGAIAVLAAAGVGAWLLGVGASGPEPFVKPGLWLNRRELVAVTFPQITREAAEQVKESVEDDPNPEECITEPVARNPDVNLFDPGNKGKCVLSGFQIGSGRLSGYLNCPMAGVQGGMVTMVFRGSYDKTSIVMDSDVTMAQPSGTLMKFKARDSSHWVADRCNAENR
jgi:hypothetical protein